MLGGQHWHDVDDLCKQLVICKQVHNLAVIAVIVHLVEIILNYIEIEMMIGFYCKIALECYC